MYFYWNHVLSLSCQNNLAKTNAFIWVKVDSWAVQRSRHLARLPLFQFHHGVYSRVQLVQVVFPESKLPSWTYLCLWLSMGGDKTFFHLFSLLYIYVTMHREMVPLQGFRISSGSTVIQQRKSCRQCCCWWCDLSVTCFFGNERQLLWDDSQGVCLSWATSGKTKNIEFWK